MAIGTLSTQTPKPLHPGLLSPHTQKQQQISTPGLDLRFSGIDIFLYMGASQIGASLGNLELYMYIERDTRYQ